MAYAIEFNGETLTLDLDEIDVSEARMIKRLTGLPLIKFQEALFDVDPDCAVAAYWLSMKQSGKPAVDPQRTNFKIVKFSNALAEAAITEARERAEREAAEAGKEDGDGQAAST